MPGFFSFLEHDGGEVIVRHRLVVRQWVPFPVERVFAFFADPQNLPPLMPRWQEARIDSASIVVPSSRHTDAPAAGEGSRMTISFRPAPLVPVRMHWEASIVAFAWDDHFCDEQVSGPFAYWLHCHRVVAEARDGVSGTIVTDDVTYAMKFGVFGDLGVWLGGAVGMRLLFGFRQRRLMQLLRDNESLRS